MIVGKTRTSGKPSVLTAKKEAASAVRFRNPGDILFRLATDAAMARIRHRALLDVLSEGKYDFTKYRDRFEKIKGRDFSPLVDLHVLTPRAFKEKHSHWIAADQERYGQVSIAKATPPKKK